LIQLDLGYNEISELYAIKFLTNLSSLSLRSNKIIHLDALKSLKNLSQLNLRFNQITDIHPLKQLTCLVDLNLADNLITEMPDWVISFELDLKLATLEDNICLETDTLHFCTCDVIEKNKLRWGEEACTDNLPIQAVVRDSSDEAYLAVLKHHQQRVNEFAQVLASNAQEPQTRNDRLI
jgi:hypothetical protein